MQDLDCHFSVIIAFFLDNPENDPLGVEIYSLATID
jgi:hypothetical protein